MQTFKQNVYKSKILSENFKKSLESFVDLDTISPSLQESKLFQEFFLIIHDFLREAHVFFSLVQRLHTRLRELKSSDFSIETLIEQIRSKSLDFPQKTEPDCRNIRTNQSFSPMRSPQKLEKRSKTPVSETLQWKLQEGGKELQVSLDIKNEKSVDSVIKKIIEKSFEKKIQKGHCFVYEECDQEMDRSWKELLDLRSEITRLLWEEERRVMDFFLF